MRRNPEASLLIEIAFYSIEACISIRMIVYTRVWVILLLNNFNSVPSYGIKLTHFPKLPVNVGGGADVVFCRAILVHCHHGQWRVLIVTNHHSFN